VGLPAASYVLTFSVSACRPNNNGTQLLGGPSWAKKVAVRVGNAVASPVCPQVSTSAATLQRPEGRVKMLRTGGPQLKKSGDPELRKSGGPQPRKSPGSELSNLSSRSNDLLAHVAPLGWEHIALTRDYVWSTVKPESSFRPLRDIRAAFLGICRVLNKPSDDPILGPNRSLFVCFRSWRALCSDQGRAEPHCGPAIQLRRADCRSLGRFRLGQRCQGWCLHNNSGSSLYVCSPEETLTRRRHSEHLASTSGNSLMRAIMGMRPRAGSSAAPNARLNGAMQFKNRCYAPKMRKRRSSRRRNI
jgi:hypothetical protein